MIDMPGFQIKDKIYESSKTLVYRGLRTLDKQPVILKTLKNKYPTTAEVNRLKHEYDLMSSLDYPWAVRVLSMEFYGNCPVIVMEDFGGESLAALLKNEHHTLPGLLDLAIRITHILEKIHEKNIIHKDINLSNIIWNSGINRLKIIDFGISTKLSRENLSIKNPNQLEGTLSYISPEQTGRMNRPLDYRTDYYSLGVTFYQMFTRQLPFESTDPLELVHCHLARMPFPPHKLNREIPPPLSKIILKLLAKIPEERYQGSYGLRKDLERCFDTLKKGKSEDFEIGQEDIPEKFFIPERLYGREEEISEIIKLFNNAANGKTEMLFVSGSPGIGKSALINEIHKPIVKRRGHYCSGKYGQFSREIPYSAIIQAFRELLKQLLSESEEKLAILRKEILEAVGGSGQVIIDVINEVEFITGKQPQVLDLPPTEAQNRFNMVFQNFVRVFAKKEHPLVLFLDDLQWADSASLELIQTLLEDIELNYFLFIGAYRDSEVDSGHPLSLIQEKMKNSGLSWENIHVAPLNDDHIRQLSADTLHCQREKTENLANLLLQKTGGNPFFLKEYLKTLYERGLIEFRRTQKGRKASWTWDISQIQKAGITENIVDLLAEKVKKLPENTWDVLKILCCTGEKFSLTLLASIYGKSDEETLEDLRQAVEEGIIIAIDNSLKFVHDRVLEAAYSLLNAAERKKLHYTIGKSLLGQGDKDQLEESIFSIAHQWNQAKELLNEKEKRQLLEINFKAGQRAKFSTAYVPAANFFRQGEELFSNNPWESDYKFTLSYYTEWSEAEYLTRNVEDAERLFDFVLQNARELLDKINIFSLQIAHYHMQTQYKKALDRGLTALKELGIKIPGKPGKKDIMVEFIKAKILSRKRKIRDWLHQPEMTETKKIAALRILQDCSAPALVVGGNFIPFNVMKTINLTFKYGNSLFSAYAYNAYGVILSVMMSDIDNGYEFSEVAIKLVDRYKPDVLKSRVYFSHGFMVMHQKRPFREISEYFYKCQEISRAAGDFTYLGYTYCNYTFILLYSGEHLDSIKNDFYLKYQDTVVKLNQHQSTNLFNVWFQGILNLLGESADTLLLKGTAFNEEKIIPEFQETKDSTGMVYYYSVKQIIYYLMGEYSEAYSISQRVEELQENAFGSPMIHVAYFFFALAASALCTGSGRKRQKKFLKKIKDIQKKYKKWSEHNRYNYLNKYLLISAEISRINGKDIQETAGLYNEAIKVAHENGLIQEEGIANELAAQYYISLGQEKIAALYMNEAHYCFKRWGCKPKAKQLEEKYPDWISGKTERTGRAIDDITLTTSTSDSSEVLDLGAIIKASNTISREIKLEELLKKMMHIVIENAGAQKGYFLLFRDGDWFIEAEEAIDQGEVKISEPIPIDSMDNDAASAAAILSKNIVKYVQRTQETVVLNDAVHEGRFTEDEYIKKQKPKSVLCFPLLNQGKLTGILYMENNLTTGAFTPERLEVLNILSSQIAISVENAELYENLEKKVAQRTQELREKNEQILDSIYYSKRIQSAIMPPEEKLKAALPEHFILFLPRDIVSGDFYWFTEIDDVILFAVVDCTGHGVPGALLAMMGGIFLNEIINTNRIVEPGKILEELHKKVRTHLQQEEAVAKSMDGMDICLCRMDKKKSKLHFAGAGRPLYVVRAGKAGQASVDEKHIEFKGNRKPIGGRQKEITRTYNTIEIPLRKGDMIYLTSDGFIDQQDPNMNRYGSKKLRAKLSGIARAPVNEQKHNLEEELKVHQDTESQRDDITIVGIRF